MANMGDVFIQIKCARQEKDPIGTKLLKIWNELGKDATNEGARSIFRFSDCTSS